MGRDDIGKIAQAVAQHGQPAAPGAPPTGTPTSEANAQAWNAPGGGYDNWKAGDPQREQQFPPGTPVEHPGLYPPNPDARPAPQPVMPVQGGNRGQR